MPKYEVGNYEEVEDLAKPLKAGTYEVEVHSGIEKTSQKGSPMFAWELKVINNEDADINGSTLFYNTPLEGKGRMFLLQLFKGCGVAWQGNAVDLPEDLVGRTCFVAVNNYVYEGVPQAGVKSVIPK